MVPHKEIEIETDDYKKRQINFLLGLGEESSSDESENE